MLVQNVELSDYGRYECVARNELGFATATIKLSVTSAPEPPYNLQVLNITHDSVTLQWSAGFDGGLPASYRLRYKPILQPNQNYHYEDTGNGTLWTVRGLQLGTEYRFSVMASNHLGISKYIPDTFKVTTSSKFSILHTFHLVYPNFFSKFLSLVVYLTTLKKYTYLNCSHNILSGP